ncbi:oligosaccharide flippase family protein [Clostridium perfringens]|uniref:oligosaccharide flippase family protein n=1 Tax=Clostridium perfringens TaxID=1502 RepID=UPI0018E497EC|nr:oligosaccharide flippase family protein [Clostridium perfringens]MBI6066214.1 polysaccharide biosynthesis protein [Clostridium perfringens]MDK0606752.1 oligosaccharide flippase family protein [Clostridium perfringens]MDZ5031031.1 oligosaccharide flippase family protein [Clostridium perfringens]
MVSNTKYDVIISYISIFITIIVTFFLTKFQVKYLGRDMFGVLGLVNSTIGYISIMEMGIGQTVIKYLTHYKSVKDSDNMSKLIGHSLKAYLKIALVGLIAGGIVVLNSKNIFCSLDNNNRIFDICFILALINVLLQIPATTFYSVLSAYKEFKFLKIINIIRTIFRFILITILLINGFSIVSIFVVNLVLMQISNIIIYIYAKLNLNMKISFKPIDKDIRDELSKYSFFVFLFLITDQIFWKTDSILLGIISTTSIVAIYSISGQIIMQFRQLSSTFSSVFLPKIVEELNNENGKEKVNKFYIDASKYQYILIMMIFITYFCVGKEFIYLWVGGEYLDAYYYSLVILISTLIPMSQTTSYQILYALSKHKIRSIVFFICAVINLILSIILFKIFGAFGVALATAIAMIISDNIFINIYYKHIMGLKFNELFKKAFLTTTIVGFITWAWYCLLNSFISFYSWRNFILKCFIGSLVYLLLIFFLVLNKEERFFIKNKIKRG